MFHGGVLSHSEPEASRSVHLEVVVKELRNLDRSALAG